MSCWMASESLTSAWRAAKIANRWLVSTHPNPGMSRDLGSSMGWALASQHTLSPSTGVIQTTIDRAELFVIVIDAFILT